MDELMWLVQTNAPAETDEVNRSIGLGTIATIIAIFAGLAVLAKALRHYVQDQAEKVARKIQEQVDTTNGKTIGVTAKDTADQVNKLTSTVQSNRVLIENMERRLDKRIDEHIVRGHEQ